MARPRAIEHTRHSPKKISVEDIANGTARLQEVLTAINDFSQEGFPYRDAARAKAELQLRECVKQVFGERSQEFHAYQHCTLHTSNGAETAQSIAAVKRLLSILEEKKLELQGLTPPPATPQSSGTGKINPMNTTQMRLVPPGSSATMAPEPIQVTVPRPVSVTMTSSLPPEPVAVSSPPPAPVPVPPISPTSTQPLSPIKIQPTTTDQSPKIQAPPPSPPAPEPVTTMPPAPRTIIPSSIPVPPLAPSALPLVSISSEATAASAQQTFPEPTPSSYMTATQPVTIQASQLGPASHPLPVQEALPLIRKVCLRFHAVARQLRLRADSRPKIEIEDDHDLGDLLRALLRLEFDEVGTDEWTPPYSGGTTKTMLLLDRERIAVVAKKTRPGLTDKEIAEQVAADSGFYSAHNKCTTFFCFVYDPEGRIGSPKRLEADLTKVSDRYTVEVLITPK